MALLRQTVSGVSPNQTTATDIYYVHTDHINTPRLVTQASNGAIRWRWDDTDPYGMLPPNENPAGSGAFVLNLRMPGQYYDRESNLYYNYFRDYDPQTGRYVQSDPIGIEGGINVYTYVNGNPVKKVDMDGLQGFLPTPVGPIPIPIPVTPKPPGIDYPKPDFDPWRDTDATTRVPPFPPAKGPKNDRPSCRAMFEACMTGAKRCTSGLKYAVTTVCLAAYFTCMATGQGDGPGTPTP